MYLGEDKSIIVDSEKPHTPMDLDAAVAGWEHAPASTISHHGHACCDIAREWFMATDFSQLNAGHVLTGPRWLRNKFKWGPSKWPLYWCEAAREKTLDCGALGALSHQLYLARGVRSFPMQLILEFNDVSTRHWSDVWNAAGCRAAWINEGLIYHEGCAVAIDETEIKLWDSTATWWINPRQSGGYAGVLAVRVFGDAIEQQLFQWGPHHIPLNAWHRLAPGSAPKVPTKRRARSVRKTVKPAAIV
jgi:hypothetical protein